MNRKTLYLSQFSVFMRPYTMTTDQEVGSSTLSGCATLDLYLSRVLPENKPECRIDTEVLFFLPSNCQFLKGIPLDAFFCSLTLSQNIAKILAMKMSGILVNFWLEDVSLTHWKNASCKNIIK
jgi:hypothetical protein